MVTVWEVVMVESRSSLRAWGTAVAIAFGTVVGFWAKRGPSTTLRMARRIATYRRKKRVCFCMGKVKNLIMIFFSL
jgi:hypothetical protein